MSSIGGDAAIYFYGSPPEINMDIKLTWI